MGFSQHFMNFLFNNIFSLLEERRHITLAPQLLFILSYKSKFSFIYYTMSTLLYRNVEPLLTNYSTPVLSDITYVYDTNVASPHTMKLHKLHT